MGIKRNHLGILFCNILLIIFLTATAVFFVCQSGILRPKPRVEARAENTYKETLRVAADIDYMPYSGRDETGTGFGHDVELITLLANRLRMNLEIEFMTWEEALRAVNAGESDLLLTYDYSNGADSLLKSMSTSADEIFVYSKMPLHSPEELYHKKCAVMDYGDTLTRIHPFQSEQNIVLRKSNREAMRAVETGEADCAIVPSAVGDILIQELAYRDVKPRFSIGSGYSCIGFAKHNTDLAARVDEALAALRSEGVLKHLHDKWLTTFTHKYNISENIANHLWTIIFPFVAVIFGLVCLIIEEKRLLRDEEEKNRYIEIVENLANDFETVIHIKLHDDPLKDEVFIIRNSERMVKVIPELKNKLSGDQRVAYLCDRIVAPEDREHFRENARRDVLMSRLNTNGSDFINFRAVFDGQKYYFQIKIAAVFDENRKIKSIVAGVHDIDEQTRREMAAQEELREALVREKEIKRRLTEENTYLDFFLKNFTVAILLDLETLSYQIVHVADDVSNVLADFIYHGRRDSFIETYIHPDDQETVRKNSNPEYIMARLRSEKSYSFMMREMINGQERDVRCMIVRGLDEKHLTVGFMDITETVTRERDTQQRLTNAINARTEFIYNLSHDIRTPMNAVKGFTEKAKKNLNDPDCVLDCLNKISNAGEHLLNLVNEVLDMSRLESGKIVSELKIVNIREEAEKMASICRENAARQNIALILNMDEITHPIVQADVLHINRIVNNLLGNAVKYTKAGGSVIYTLHELPCDDPAYGCYHFSIEDTGVGISQEFLQKIFEPFSREETAANAGVRGTGLGMMIVKQLVDFLDGKITIESKLEHGTKVTLEFKFKLSEEPIKIDACEEEPFDLSGKRVLLVEDYDLNREIVGDVLRDQGLIVEEAGNGCEAVKTVREHGTAYYDFVLMDIQMPIMDGYEATRAIRALSNGKELIIIAFSASAFAEDLQKCKEAGMNAHIAKPIEVSTLRRVISDQLRGI